MNFIFTSILENSQKSLLMCSPEADLDRNCSFPNSIFTRDRKH